jgi:hypothetical protein
VLTEEIRNRWKQLIVFGLFSVVFAGAAFLVYFVFLGALSGPEATAVATLFLVAVTGGYGAVTYEMMRETRKARHQEIVPVFEPHVREDEIALVNGGNGPAHKLDATIGVQPAGVICNAQLQSVSPGSQAVILDRTFPNIGALDYFDRRMEHPDIDIFEIDEEEFPHETEKYPYRQLMLNESWEDLWGTKSR